MTQTAEDFARLLRHPDPSQLWYQLDEIVTGRAYTRCGVEVGDGDVVIDAGANVGVAAAFFALACGAGQVHCFEPVPAVFAILEENAAHVPGCVAHNVGLSSSPGPAELTYYPGAAAMSGLHADPREDRDLVHRVLVNRGATSAEASSRLEGSFEPQVVRCELTTLSEAIRTLGITRVDLLKVDVEKAELEVLAGLESGDWPLVRQVAMESHDAGRAAAAAALLRERGFAVTVEQDPGLRETGLRMVYAVRG